MSPSRRLPSIHAHALAGTLDLPGRNSTRTGTTSLRRITDAIASPDWAASASPLHDALEAYCRGDFTKAAQLLEKYSIRKADSSVIRNAAVAMHALCFVHMAQRGESYGTGTACEHLQGRVLADLRRIESTDPSGRLPRVRAALDEYLRTGVMPKDFEG